MHSSGARAVVAVLVFLLLAVVAESSEAVFGGKSIRVMTRNQYLGADLDDIVGATTVEEFAQAVEEALGDIGANNFPLRAWALALEVKATRPHVIGLQEVFNFTRDGVNVPGTPFVDHLDTFLGALRAKGLHYRVAGVVYNFDQTIPLGPEVVARVVDRDVILVKQGLRYRNLHLCGVSFATEAPAPFPETFNSQPSGDGCTYTVVASVQPPPPFELIVQKRGFVAVDVWVYGRVYRIYNTHLEVREPQPGNPLSRIVQSLQAAELVGTALFTTPPGKILIALGDFNSAAEDVAFGAIPPPYQLLAGAGFVDVWSRNLLGFLNPDGFTCCQDELLDNAVSELDERIDLIFVRNADFLALAFVVGNRPQIPFGPPFWGSDHAGVFAKILLKRRHSRRRY